MNTIIRQKCLFILFFFFSVQLNAFEYFVKIKQNDNVSETFSRINNELKKGGSKSEITFHRAFLFLTEMGLEKVYVLNSPVVIGESNMLRISQLENVDYIEVVPQYDFFYTPNDYSSTTQWHLAKIDAFNAWNIEKGGKGIIIGLIDDGLDTLHSDLQPVLWHNFKEVKGNGIDDDKNGYIDDFFGWDAADNDADPSVTVNDNLTHGTHCAGIAGALTDNNNGIASVGFNIRIMAVKTGRKGQKGLYNPYLGVEYAIVNGANVLSMSWGGGPQTYSSTYQILFDVAFKRNIVCIAAAQNNYDSIKGYPAGYNHVISVGSTDINDVKSPFSCYGSWVDIMAPGSNIYSTLPGNSYGYKSGTSMATPMVSGLCALMLSKNSALTPTQVENCLKSSADNINSMNSSLIGLIGAGRINALKALACVKGVYANFRASKTFVCTGDTVQFFDVSTPYSSSRIWTFQGGTPSASSNLNPIVRYNTNGTYKVELIAIKGKDQDTLVQTSYITVGKPKVTFSGVQTIEKGEFGTIRADFTGNPPWRLVYSDGKKLDTVSNIGNTPFFILKTPDSTTTYKPIEMISNGCGGDVKDSTRINVTNFGTSNCDSTLRYHLNFGGSGDDQAFDIAVADTFTYISGRTTSNGSGNFDAFVAKVGQSGKVYWYRTLGGSAEDGFLTIELDKFQNVYCGGYSHSSVNWRASMLVKYDKNGNLKWKKYYNGVEREYIYDVMVSKDHKSIYYTGHSLSDSYGGEDFSIYKLDTGGTVQWVKRYGASNNERPLYLLEDDSLNVYGLGVVYPGGYQKGCIVKVKANGSMVYAKDYVTSNSNEQLIYTGAENWNKQYMYVTGSMVKGSSARRAFVSKVNYNGSVLWTREINYGTFVGSPKLRIIDNKLILVAYSTVSGQNFGIILTLDSNANILSSKTIGSNSQQSFINAFDINQDKSISYVGFQFISGNNQYAIGKTNCKMDNVCLFNAFTPSTAAVTLTPSNYFMLSKDFTQVINPTHNNNSYNLSSVFTCRSKIAPVVKKCRLGADFKMIRSCTGSEVQFKDNTIDSSNFNIDNYFWEFSDGAKFSGTSTVKRKFTFNGNYNVKLIVTSSSGGLTCSDTVVKSYYSSDSLYMEVPVHDTSICIGDSMSIALPKIDCGIGPYKFRWTPSIGLNDSTLAQPFFSPKKTTRYNLKLIDINGNSYSDTIRIEVNKSCCVSQARFRMEKNEVCIGDSVQFINESSYSNGSEFFRWNFIGANISTFIGKQPPKIVFKTGVPNKAILLLSDICSNDTAKMNVYLRRLPEANAGRDSFLCRVDTLNIGSVGLGRDEYIWTPSIGMNDSTLSDPTVIINKKITYFLKVINENGCISRDTVNFDIEIKKMKIHNDTLICSADSLQLSIPITGSYLWSNGKTSKQISINQPGTYWGQSTANCIYRDTVVIGAKPNPVFSLGKDSAFCSGDSIELKASIAGSYLWNTGSVSNTIRVKQSGSYWLRINNGGCVSRDTVNVTVLPKPVFSLGPNKKLCLDSINLVPNISFPNAKYLWNNGETLPNIYVSSFGQYTLRIEEENGCAYSDTILVLDGIKPRLDEIDPIYKCINVNFLLELPDITGQTYTWYDQTSGVRKMFPQPGNFWVKAKTECGDSIQNFEIIDSSCVCNFYIPNAISANSDNINDAFGVVAQCNLLEYTLIIFNRWGEIIFKSKDPKEKWDGTYKSEKVMQGVYFYSLEFRKDLQSYKEYVYTRGSINVLR